MLGLRIFSVSKNSCSRTGDIDGKITTTKRESEKKTCHLYPFLKWKRNLFADAAIAPCGLYERSTAVIADMKILPYGLPAIPHK